MVRRLNAVDLTLTLMWFALAMSSGEEMSRETVHDDPAAIYPYHLLTDSAFGRIHESALVGSEIPIDKNRPLLDGLHVADGDGYLMIELYENLQYMDESQNATSNTQELQLGPTVPLPENVRIDISSEHVTGSDVQDAFDVDEKMRLAVGERTELFKNVDLIEFWVVAVNHTPGYRSQIVSNPLAFIITVDHTEPEREGATLYAGIVFGAICLFALIIPFTVRTKRRLHQGKPVFGCGSHKPLQPEREITRGNGSHAAGIDNLAMVLNDGKPTNHSQRRGTFQSHEMRSFSSHHFQPHWLDPHYDHTYEHPQYRKASTTTNAAIATNSNNTPQHQASTSTGAAAVPGTSSGSNGTYQSLSENL